jgi:putative flippase GtrA
VKLVALYAWFAILAIATNFATQFLVDIFYFGMLKIWFALAAGTGAGLILKYALDKKYIFQYETKTATHDLKLIILYGFFGLATTTIFWAGELGFDALFHNTGLRYLGGGLGLVIGYYLKFQLDKRFVFRKTAS